MIESKSPIKSEFKVIDKNTLTKEEKEKCQVKPKEHQISDRLRFVMSITDSPKLLEMCSKIAVLPINLQESLLDCVQSDIDLNLVLRSLEVIEHEKSFNI